MRCQHQYQYGTENTHPHPHLMRHHHHQPPSHPSSSNHHHHREQQVQQIHASLPLKDDMARGGYDGIDRRRNKHTSSNMYTHKQRSFLGYNENFSSSLDIQRSNNNNNNNHHSKRNVKFMHAHHHPCPPPHQHTHILDQCHHRVRGF
jgi:hypothetical protein